MEHLLEQINSLGSFELNLLASAVFGVLILIGKFLLNKAQEFGKHLVGDYEKRYLYKYASHHEIFNSPELPKPTRQFFYVILTALTWLIAAVMALVFVYGVKALTSKDWFIFLGHWFAFNYLYEALTWAKDSREDKTAKALVEQQIEQTK